MKLLTFEVRRVRFERRPARRRFGEVLRVRLYRHSTRRRFVDVGRARFHHRQACWRLQGYGECTLGGSQNAMPTSTSLLHASLWSKHSPYVYKPPTRLWVVKTNCPKLYTLGGGQNALSVPPQASYTLGGGQNLLSELL